MKANIIAASILVLVLTLVPRARADGTSSATKVRAKLLFTTPVVWVGAQEPPEEESSALLQAIGAFETNGVKAGFDALEEYVNIHPNSAWSPCLNTHLAEHYRQAGRYTLAIEHWDAAWKATKDSGDTASREVAARALAGWTSLLASLGRVQQLDELFAEAKRLGFDRGLQAPALQATQEGLATMKTRPETAYRCGSFALAQLLRSLQPDNPAWRRVHDAPSPQGGFSMSALLRMAQTNGYTITAARRPTGDHLVVPSLVHWKLDHYAAIVEQKGGSFLVVDPTFGGKRWLDAQTINAEASGSFLVAGTNLPPGWRPLGTDEAAIIHGKGGPNNINDGDDDDGGDDPPCPPPPGPPGSGDGPGGGDGGGCDDGSDSDGNGYVAGDDPSNFPHSNIVAGDDPSNYPTGQGGGGYHPPPDVGVPSGGMPTWRISEPFISLWLHDAPLFYKDSSRKTVALQLSYNHRGGSKGPTVGGFGDKWECRWIGMLEQTTTNSLYITNYLAGGGLAGFPVSGDKEYKSARSLKIITTNASLIINSPYGHQNQYGFPLTYLDGTVRYFLTNRVNQFGQTTRFTYERHTNADLTVVVRLIQVTDQDGKQCSLAYANTNFANLITSVTDPYNRSAYFIYDSQRRLTNITDTATLPSSFNYASDGSITNLHTLYGDTRFRYFWGTNSLCAFNRAIEITEATDAKQLYAYRDLSPSNIGIYETYDPYPSNRNSFHWDRLQYAALSDNAKTNVLDMPVADYKKGSLKHWLHGEWLIDHGTVVSTLSAGAGPVLDTNSNYRVNSVFLQYAGQSDNSFVGTLRAVTAIRWDFGNNYMEIPRNAWGRPTQFIYFRSSGTVAFTNEFNADGRILRRVWGPNGELVRGYGYDATFTNLLTSVTNPVGDVLRYTYDTNTMKVTSITFPSGLVRSNIYYTSGTYAGFLQVQAEFQASTGFSTNYFTYVNGNVFVRTNALGLATTNTWDDLNRLRCVTFPDGTIISNNYDKLDLVGVKDRLGYWTMYTYNPIRQMVTRTNANSRLTQYDYCNCGALSQITDWNGATPLLTTFAYDLAGRLTNTVYPDGYILNSFYAPPSADKGGPIRVEDSSGLAVEYEFGDYWQLQNVGLSHVPNTGPDAYLLTRTFDEYGRVVSSTDRNGIRLTTAYDFLGRVLTNVVLDLYGQPRSTNTFVYTPRGLTNSVDALGYTNRFVRDALGQLLSRTNANNEALQFTYNALGEILTLTDGKNQTTSWNYDEYGRATNKVDAANNVIFRYNYDADGRFTNRWTPAKGDTFYGYNPVGNLTNVDYPGTVMDVALQYDGLNRLTNIVDAIGNTRFTYNNAGQLLSEDGPWVSDTVAYTYSQRRRAGLSLSQPNASPWAQTYAYDQYNRLTNIISSAGQFGYVYSGYTLSDLVGQVLLPGYSDTSQFYIGNQFDDLARLTSTTLYKDQYTVVNQHSYEMNNANQRTRQTFKNGNYTDYTYDKIGQLATAQATDPGNRIRLNERYGYLYDAAGNLRERDYPSNNSDPLKETFGLNSLNELTNVTRTGSLTVAGTTTSAATNVTVNGLTAELYVDFTFAQTNVPNVSGNNTFTAIAKDAYGRTDTNSITCYLPTNVSLSYDLNGNLTNDGSRTFEYDFDNQLTNVYVANAWRSEFEYDGMMRRRIRREYAWNGSAWIQTNEVRYIYDGRLVVQERDANNLPQVSYTRGNDLSGSLQGAGGIGGLLARSDNRLVSVGDSSAHAFYHSDGNGNITALTSAQGFLVAKYQYDPYGNILSMSGPMATANLYRFSSKENHANSGLVYYLYRYYDPALQRWVNRDPLGEPGGLNLYTFTASAPVNSLDPFGECAFVIPAVVALAEWLGISAEATVLVGGSVVAAGAAVAVGSALTSHGPSGTGLSNANAVPVIVATAPIIANMGKGERGWEKGRGDDPFWLLTAEALRAIENNPASTPDEKARARRIRKQKEKGCS